jgi:hypothetical protein
MSRRRSASSATSLANWTSRRLRLQVGDEAAAHLIAIVVAALIVFPDCSLSRQAGAEEDRLVAGNAWMEHVLKRLRDDDLRHRFDLSPALPATGVHTADGEDPITKIPDLRISPDEGGAHVA